MKRQKILMASFTAELLNGDIEQHNKEGWSLVIGSIQCHDMITDSAYKNEPPRHTPQWTCVVEREKE